MSERPDNAPPKVDIFLMGVSKAASTWIYRCLKEHPKVFVSASDSLRFFDLEYHSGIEAYERHFAGAEPGQVVVDVSPTYFRSPVAAARIATHYPDARFVLSLRNPVDRAFSQYWHEKKQGRMQYGFDDCIGHFMLFPWIVEHGFYATHLETLLRYFPRDRVTVVFYDELTGSPRTFLDKVLVGMGLPTHFEPTVLNAKINVAGAQITSSMKAVKGLRSHPLLQPLRRYLKRFVRNRSISRAMGEVMSSKGEYEQGVPDALRRELQKIYEPEIRRLEQTLEVNLDHWRR